jgi:hypothetical protein
VKNIVTCLIASLIGFSTCWAQTRDPAPKPVLSCDARTGQEKAAWARSKHPWLVNVLHTERSDIEQTWCRIWETAGYDRINKAEDFGRTFFTGEGIHPAFGGIVPGSGFAGGGAFNVGRALTSVPLRFEGSTEARVSLNKFWTVGGEVNLLGSSQRQVNRHNQVSFLVRHSDLPQLAYFGIGGSSQLSQQTLYGLTDTTGSATLNIPVPKDFSFTARVAGVSLTPSGFNGAATPSIEQRFNPTNTPALGVAVTDVVYGGGIDWTYPAEERIGGYRAQVSATMQWFSALNGAPYSFRRFDAAWNQKYTPQVGADLGTISISARVAESLATSGNVVPFFQQPTLGGMDIENQPTLRSYRDYRFRAPHLMLFQAEYERTLYHGLPLGMLLFYDVGKVAVDRSDLDFKHMPHSLGIGLTLHGGGLPLVRLYYAWGGHEGAKGSATGNTNNFGVPGDMRGVF